MDRDNRNTPRGRGRNSGAWVGLSVWPLPGLHAIPKGFKAHGLDTSPYRRSEALWSDAVPVCGCPRILSRLQVGCLHLERDRANGGLHNPFPQRCT